MKHLHLLLLVLIPSLLISQNFNVVPFGYFEGSPQGIRTANFDLDEDLEIVFTLISKDSIMLLDKVNEMYLVKAIGNGDSPFRLGVSDFTNDALLDISFSTDDIGGLSILKNEGSLAFTKLELNPIEFGSGYDLTIEDFDNDEDQDLIMTSIIYRQVVLLENQNSNEPEFVKHVLADDLHWPQEVNKGDVDQNGLMDIVVCVINDGIVQIFLNQNNLMFTPIEISSIFPFPSGNAIGDLNGDSMPDICINHRMNGIDKFGAVTILVNENGGTSYSSYILDSVIHQPNSAEISDFDNDNDQDIIVSSQSGLVFYENINPAELTFTSHYYLQDKWIWDLHVVDIEGDGDSDLLCTATYDNEIFLLENEFVTNTKSFASTEFKLYPNPTLGQIQIESEIAKDLYIKIYSNLGHCIFEDFYDSGIDISMFPVGLYLLQIYDPVNGRFINERIIKN